MTRNIVIVHYNTPKMTMALIKSIHKHTDGCNIYIFVNSDKYPFPQTEGITIIDNTKGQLIDFDKLLDKYPNKVKTCNNHASSKHIASVDMMFDYVPDGFLLMDSDILIKKDISEFFDESYAWIGKIETQPEYWFQAQRLYPFLLWINVPMCNKYGIRFWHERMSYKLSHRGKPPYYDTGSSFYWDCQGLKLPGKEIDIDEYMVHFRGASYNWKKDPDAWLEEYKELYNNESIPD